MASSSGSFHEAEGALSPTTKDMHRAIVSLMEELEAIDWYQQRIDAASDGELKEILRHNRDEEKEHAAMVLEWIRRRDPSFDGVLRAFLFTDGPITALEPGSPTGSAPRGAAGSGNGPFVTVGSLRGTR
jgi:ferritin-like protein